MKIDSINTASSRNFKAKNNNSARFNNAVSFTSGLDKVFASQKSASKISSVLESIKGKLHKLFERFSLKNALLNVFEKSKKASSLDFSSASKVASSTVSNVASSAISKEEKVISQAQTLSETKIPNLSKDIIFDKPLKQILKAPVENLEEKQVSFTSSKREIMGLIPEKTSASLDKKPEIKFINGIAYGENSKKINGEISIPSPKKPILTFEDGRLTKATYKEGENQIVKEYFWGESKLENARMGIHNKGSYPETLREVSFEPDGVVVSEHVQNKIDEDGYLFSGKISKKFQGGKLKKLAYQNGGSIQPYREIDFENKKVTFYPLWLQRRVVFDMKNDKVMDYFIDSPEKEIFAFEADRKTGKVKINPRILLMRIAKKDEIKGSAQKALAQFDTYKEKYFND